MSQKTAILFFTRSIGDEVRSKRFHRTPKTSIKIADYLIRRTRNLLAESGFPVFEISSKSQSGKTPNERFHNALTSVFTVGYERIITVGNDCPQLTVRDIESAAEGLDHNSIVFGPDMRGGTFLIGFKKETYRPEYILEAHWGDHSFLKSISRHFADDQVQLLETLHDLNEIPRVHYLKKIGRSNLLKPLIDLIQLVRYKLYFISLYVPGFQMPAINRGPPAILSF